jgi:hypothetical protein
MVSGWQINTSAYHKGVACSLNANEDVDLFRVGLNDMPFWVKYLCEVGFMSRPPWWGTMVTWEGLQPTWWTRFDSPIVWGD